MDNPQIAIRKTHLSLQLRWAKKGFKTYVKEKQNLSMINS